MQFRRRWLQTISILAALLVLTGCESPVTGSAGEGHVTREPAEAPAKPSPTSQTQPSAQPVVLLPDGEPPQEGWPTVVMLHGYRSNERDFVPVGRLAAAEGLAAVSLPAPFERGEGHYHWKQGQPEHTHTYVQDVVAGLDATKEGLLDTRRLWLAGFSQGAMHSVHLASKHPDAYHGVLAISPAGWTAAPEAVANPDVRRDFVLVGGRAEKPRYRDSFRATRDILAASKLPLETIEHDGGHQFPPHWRAQFAKVFSTWASR